MDEEEKYYITLNCEGCDNSICRLNHVIDRNKDGCVRQVDEDLYINYYHQTKEVWPFARQESFNKIQQEYKKTMDVLEEVYRKPCTKKYGKGFKVVVLKDET